MASHGTIVLLGALLLIGCGKSSETKDKPDAPPAVPPVSDVTDDSMVVEPVEIGRDYGQVTAASARELHLGPGATLTEVQEGTSVAYRMNTGDGLGSFQCRCDSGCSGACVAEVGDTIAKCSGTCEGLSDDGRTCGACTWHFKRPKMLEVDPTP